MKTIKSLKGSSVLIDRVTETVKHEIKKKGKISWSFFSLVSDFISTRSNFLTSKRYKWNRCKKKEEDDT